MIAIVANFILILIAALSNAYMDLLAHGKIKSYDPNSAWKNKYKADLKTPKFLFSTTILVWITDSWHLTQFIFHSSWQLMIAINLDSFHWFINFILIKFLFSLLFEITYRSK